MPTQKPTYVETVPEVGEIYRVSATYPQLVDMTQGRKMALINAQELAACQIYQAKKRGVENIGTRLEELANQKNMGITELNPQEWPLFFVMRTYLNEGVFLLPNARMILTDEKPDLKKKINGEKRDNFMYDVTTPHAPYMELLQKAQEESYKRANHRSVLEIAPQGVTTREETSFEQIFDAEKKEHNHPLFLWLFKKSTSPLGDLMHQLGTKSDMIATFPKRAKRAPRTKQAQLIRDAKGEKIEPVIYAPAWFYSDATQLREREKLSMEIMFEYDPTEQVAESFLVKKI